MPSIQLWCLVRHYDTCTYILNGGKKGNLYWILMRKGLEMRPPWWLRNKYENNIPMKQREREFCDMKWTNVIWFTPTLAIINLLVPLPEFNVLGTLLKHRESHLGYGLDNLGFNSWQMQETSSSPKHPWQLWSPPNLLFNGYSWLFREKSGWRMKLTSYLHLMLMLRISRASPLLPFAFVVCTGTVHRTSLQIFYYGEHSIIQRAHKSRAPGHLHDSIVYVGA